MKKVVITGPESTGKSELTRFLAAHYGCPFALEYAREYLEARDGDYRFEDLAEIARGQIAAEEVATEEARAQGAPYVFLDTDLITLKIWSEYKYSRCDAYISEQIRVRHYDLYLLCNTDLPWQPDPLREHPNHRQELMEIHTQTLVQLQKPFVLISGQGHVRLKNAVETVAEVFG